jgi:hypothetical protein
VSDQGRKPLQGAIIFAVIALALLGGACAMWPPGFFSTPFAEMSSAMLLRAGASAALAVIGIEFIGALAIVLRSDH